MQLTITQFLIVCPLIFAGGLVDAVAGGGGLISLPAYIIAGFPSHYAIATNKISACMGTTMSMVQYSRSGYVRLKSAVCCAAVALMGSSLGAQIALSIDDQVFKIMMLFILPAIMIYVAKNKALESTLEPFSETKTILISMCAAFIIGMYDGFYGPGTGTFLLLILTRFARLDLNSAMGLAKVINWSTGVASMVVYAFNGKTIWALGLIAGLFGIAGNYVGVKLFKKGGAGFVRPTMITVLVIFFIKVITELLF